jgi:rod shape-determining protein MreD
MRINQKTLAIHFINALLCLFFAPLFFPKLHLFFFAPYLVLTFYRHSRVGVLWRAYGCGIIFDLLSSSTFFGFTPLNYCLTSWLLYSQKRNFFEDKLSTLPLMTFLLSFVSTVLTFVLSLFFGQKYSLSLLWIATDLLCMPFVDSLYALVVFSLPFQLLYRLRKVRFGGIDE